MRCFLLENRSFFWRIMGCFMLILALFLAGIVRILMIGQSEKLVAQSQQNQLTVPVSQVRGNLFDCNGLPLTGTESKTVYVAAPTTATVEYLSKVLSGKERTDVLTQLQKGRPAVLSGNGPYICAGIYAITVPVHTPKEAIGHHIIGYTDQSGHGVSGLEKALDERLYSDKVAGVTFEKDGTGRVLGAYDGVVEEYREITSSGVVTTLDRNFQLICERAMESVPAGAVVVSEVGTGKIRAMVSRPDYDNSHLQDALNRKDSPLINRCLSSYNVGSSFKLCVAAASLERHKAVGLVTECIGHASIDGHTFYCHKRSGHGTVGMREAIAQSCNTYFYRLGLSVGASDIYDMATVFGFGRSKVLTEGLATTGESLPTPAALQSSDSALANLSIGQGSLLASPMSMLCLYEAIAGDGVYHLPTLVEGEMKNGLMGEKQPAGEATRAISSETAKRLREDLAYAVKTGTGVKAQPQTVSAAGKTATAQTGWLGENGQAVEHSWFCGFFPAESPRYTVCVLVEDTTTVGIGGAEIFSRIADGINGLENLS